MASTYVVVAVRAPRVHELMRQGYGWGRVTIRIVGQCIAVVLDAR
jgi:hypothetical protein